MKKNTRDNGHKIQILRFQNQNPGEKTARVWKPQVFTLMTFAQQVPSQIVQYSSDQLTANHLDGSDCALFSFQDAVGFSTHHFTERSLTKSYV